MNPFDYVNSINMSKKHMMENTENDNLAEKSYNSYIVNKSLSYFIDTILYANEANEIHHMDKRLQYDYLFYSIPKKKRFSKWAKPNRDDDLDLIIEYYQCNYTRASEILKIINNKDLEYIKQKLQKGGVK